MLESLPSDNFSLIHDFIGVRADHGTRVVSIRCHQFWLEHAEKVVEHDFRNGRSFTSPFSFNDEETITRRYLAIAKIYQDYESATYVLHRMASPGPNQADPNRWRPVVQKVNELLEMTAPHKLNVKGLQTCSLALTLTLGLGNSSLVCFPSQVRLQRKAPDLVREVVEVSARLLSRLGLLQYQLDCLRYEMDTNAEGRAEEVLGASMAKLMMDCWVVEYVSAKASGLERIASYAMMYLELHVKETPTIDSLSHIALSQGRSGLFEESFENFAKALEMVTSPETTGSLHAIPVLWAMLALFSRFFGTERTHRLLVEHRSRFDRAIQQRIDQAEHAEDEESNVGLLSDLESLSQFMRNQEARALNASGNEAANEVEDANEVEEGEQAIDVEEPM